MSNLKMLAGCDFSIFLSAGGLRGPLSGGEQEVVFTEPTGSVTTEVVLREDGHAEGGEHGRVDTDTEVTEGPYRTHVWD